MGKIKNHPNEWDINNGVVKGYFGAAKVVKIPNGVRSIGYGAFCDCKNLTSIEIPDSVWSIGFGAFRGCSGLTSVTLPDAVRSIGDDVFNDCTDLTSVTLPAGVRCIGRDVFSGCANLAIIKFRGTASQWNSISKDAQWDEDAGDYVISCLDGTISG